MLTQIPGALPYLPIPLASHPVSQNLDMNWKGMTQHSFVPPLGPKVQHEASMLMCVTHVLMRPTAMARTEATFHSTSATASGDSGLLMISPGWFCKKPGHTPWRSQQVASLLVNAQETGKTEEGNMEKVFYVGIYTLLFSSMQTTQSGLKSSSEVG